VISTKSVFYYIESVTNENFYLDFNEGSGQLSAEIESGHYTHTALALAIQEAMNAVGTQAYAVAFNRTTRAYTISSVANFSLLLTTGTHAGSDIYSLIGFTGANRTGANTYTGSAAGSEYKPQFKLQDYVDIEDLQKAVQASVNKSASGLVETVTFGTEKFFEFNIPFITDIEQGSGSVVETNLTGVTDARLFMRFITSKRELEFMPDRNLRASFFTVLLESTEESSDGVGYRLKELYTKNLPYYYESGKLVFRLVE
jgi:hypothetical protein